MGVRLISYSWLPHKFWLVSLVFLATLLVTPFPVFAETDSVQNRDAVKALYIHRTGESADSFEQFAKDDICFLPLWESAYLRETGEDNSFDILSCREQLRDGPSYTESEFAEYRDGLDQRIDQAVARSERALKEEKAQQRIEDLIGAAQITAEEEARKSATRLSACDSFGFERDTDAHAECAMRLYIAEQSQASDRAKLKALEDQRKDQQISLARQEAIQTALAEEQARVRKMEQTMNLIELGATIFSGGASGSSQFESKLYRINGEIINCYTTNLITNCF